MPHLQTYKEKGMQYKNNKMAVVVAIPEQVRYFLVNHIMNFSNMYDVTVVSNLSKNAQILDVLPIGVIRQNIPFVREISIFRDITALFLLVRYFYRKKIKIVYSVSPKSGLLSMIAARFVGVPVRIHTFTGQVWVTKVGIMKWILKLLDYVTAKLATVVIVDSPSQRDFLIDHNVVTADKSLVIGEGSISGVDIERFCPKPNVRKKIRMEMGVSDEVVVFLYVGRLKRDKGLIELSKSFLSISAELDNIALWFIGPDEDEIQGEIELIISKYSHTVKFIPYTTTPENYMVSSDVFCLPSYREGFGSTIIEAAACGIPAIGSRIYGITDAILDGKTGVLVKKGSIGELAIKMKKLKNDHVYRDQLGRNAKERVLEKFNQHTISGQLISAIKQHADMKLSNVR